MRLSLLTDLQQKLSIYTIFNFTMVIVLSKSYLASYLNEKKCLISQQCAFLLQKYALLLLLFFLKCAVLQKTAILRFMVFA